MNATVDVGIIRRGHEKTTAAMLGFRSEGSFSSMKSNLNRALRLAGAKVMPSKSRTPLLPLWKVLRQGAEVAGIWPALSRFGHWCSEYYIEPTDVIPDHLSRFGKAMQETCLRSSARKAVPKVEGLAAGPVGRLEKPLAWTGAG